MSNLTLTFLGTASARPVVNRNPTAQVLNVHGRLFLIDCGEGCQKQMVTLGVSMLKIEAIFLSHMHGDHCLGLYGLLSTMGMLGRRTPLRIYAPAAGREIVEFYSKAFGEGDGYEIEFIPLSGTSPETIFSFGKLKIEAFPLNHGVPCYGYKFTYQSLSYAFCSDTAPFEELARWVQGVSLLYHEATFPAEMTEFAAAVGHSTTLQAAACARDAGAKALVVAHYSSRYPDPSFFLDEIRSIFPNASLANDGDVIRVTR